jgi:hypothetical protein
MSVSALTSLETLHILWASGAHTRFIYTVTDVWCFPDFVTPLLCLAVGHRLNTIYVNNASGYVDLISMTIRVTTEEMEFKSQTEELHGLQSYFKSWLSFIYSKNSFPFMQFESFLPYLQKPIIGSYSESSHKLTTYFKNLSTQQMHNSTTYVFYHLASTCFDIVVILRELTQKFH